MTGQKSQAVMNRYSHTPQVINFDEAGRKIEVYVANKQKLVCPQSNRLCGQTLNNK